MAVNFKISLRSNASKLIADVEDAGRKATEEAAKALLEKANEEVPVDTGALRESGRVVTETDGSARVVYDTEYALYVHETGNKWLERAAIGGQGELKQIIGDELGEVR